MVFRRPTSARAGKQKHRQLAGERQIGKAAQGIMESRLEGCRAGEI
jgi:hypothetical protein